MLICGGVGGEPFTLPIESHGVRHLLMIGPTGSGKSTLLQAMACAYSRVKDAKIFVLDVGRSSYVLARCLGADYFDVGAQDGVPLCPLAALDHENGLQWLQGWFERLFYHWPGEGGIGQFELSEREMEDFTSSLKQCRDPRPGVLPAYSLGQLRERIYEGTTANNRIRRILDKYISDYGNIYNGSQQHITHGHVVVYETSELMGMPDKFASPAMELILYSILNQLDGKTPTWIIIDEFWRFLGNETAAEALHEALRLARRKLCGIIGCSQSLIEITQSPLCNLLVESMPLRIFLPNNAAASSQIRDKYLDLGVSEHEAGIIASGTPHQDFLFTCPEGARVGQLILDPVGQAICAATGDRDVQEAKHIWEECQNSEEFLDKWLNARVAGWQPGVLQPAAADLPDGRRAEPVAV